MNTSINVLVTAVGGGAVGRQIVKALQLSKLSVNIIVTDASPFAFGLTEADKAYIVPHATDAGYIETLLSICEKENVQFLVPGFEAELEQISTNRNHFDDIGVALLINSHDVVDLCRDKWKIAEFLRKNGFLFPRSWLVKQVQDLEQVDSFPIIVKPTRGGGSQHVYIARDRHELEVYSRLLLRENQTTMAQEYLGTFDEEYTVGILSTPKSTLIGSIALHRLIQDSVSTKLRIPDLQGKGSLAISSGFSQGIIEDYPEVRSTCEAIAATIGSKGPLNIQCRKTKQGIVPFEINPRLSGTTYIRALVGFNEPEMLIQLHLTGKKPDSISYQKGYVFRELREKFVSFEEVSKITRMNATKRMDSTP